MGACRSLLLVLVIGGFSIISNAVAQSGTAAVVESIRGDVQSGGAPIFQGQRISPGARITTGRGAELVLRFDDGMRVALPETTIFVPADFNGGRATFDLLSGAARVRTGGVVRSSPGRFALRAPQASFGVERPADFTVVVSDAAYLSVREGTVSVDGAQGPARFAAGSGAVVRAGAPAAPLQPAASPAAATISTLAAIDLERKAEEQAKAAALAAEEERRAGPAPRPQKLWIGGSINRTIYDEGATAGLLTQGSLERQATGFKVFAGYQLFRNVGIELGYTDLGETEYSGSFNGTPVANGKLKIAGFDAALVGSLAASEKAIVFGKLGTFIWEAEASDVAGGAPFSTSTDGTNVLLGLGFAYALSPKTALRAELESRRAADEAVNVLSVGLEIRF